MLLCVKIFSAGDEVLKENVSAYLEYRFEKIKLIRQTEKGEVWLVTTKSTGKLVVIKFVKLVGLPYATMQKISCGLWAEIFYCAEDSADTVIVEEFIQGENLADRKNFLTETQAKNFLLQLCDGLKILHNLGIVHRDIKPSNLILQGDKIRLIDFDAARIFKSEKSKDTKFLGTEGYAPPEQYGYSQTDARSDIFSLGKTFQELLCENCKGNLKKILSKCTEIDPKNRFQTVEELKFALLEKKSLPYKKIFLLSLILSAAGIFLFHSSTAEEKISQPVEVEKISEVEEKSSAEKIPEVKQEKNFKFPEIKIPETVSTENNFDSVQNFPVQKVSKPPLQVEQNKNPSSPVKKNKIHAKAKSFLNGKSLKDWSLYSVHVVNVKKQDWQNFFDWSIELSVKDFPTEILQSPKVKVTCKNNLDKDFYVEKFFEGQSVGEEINFKIPLNQFQFQLQEPVTMIYLEIWLLDTSGSQTETRNFFQFVLLAT